MGDSGVAPPSDEMTAESLATLAQTRQARPAVAPPRPDDQDEQDAVVTFRVGQAWLAVAAMYVEEICDATPAVRVPRAPAYIDGLMNLRGHAIPLLNLAAFLDLANATIPPELRAPLDELTPARVILVGNDGMRVGLVCDQVRSLGHVPRTSLRPPEALQGHMLRQMTSAEIVAPDLLAALLDVPTLLEAARVRK